MMRAIVSVSRVWDVSIRDSICERDSGIVKCKSISVPSNASCETKHKTPQVVPGAMGAKIKHTIDINM